MAGALVRPGLRWLVLSSLFVIAVPAGTTTLVEITRSCPVCSEPVTTYDVAGHGDYIRRWESKYDLVYWPDTEPRWIWSCQGCGYAQLGGAFVDVPPDKLANLREALRQHQSCGDTTAPAPCKLERALLVNQLLQRPSEFWSWFNRVLAYQYRQLGDETNALVAEERVIDLLESATATDLNPRMREYILGEYYRRRGDASQARHHLRAAAATRHVRHMYLGLTVLILVAGILPLRHGSLSRASKVIALMAALALSALLLWAALTSWQNNHYLERIAAERLDLL